MLELMLTRPNEQQDRESPRQALRFLVLDELHTYRGRQGADVALLYGGCASSPKTPAAVRRNVGDAGRRWHAGRAAGRDRRGRRPHLRRAGETAAGHRRDAAPGY